MTDLDKAKVEHYIKVLQALLDGKTIVNKWNGLEVTEETVITNYNKLEGFEVEEKKPSINWDHVSSEFNYLTRNEDGFCLLHALYPDMFPSGWMSKDRVIEANTFNSFDPGDCDWKDSLVYRPGFEKE